MAYPTEPLPSRLTPTSRTFTPGIIPETRFEAQNGSTSFVRFGNTLINSKLRLSYQNINEAEAFEFADFYNRCQVTDQGVRIDPGSNAVSDIKDPMLMGALVRGVDGGLTWKFEGPPAIQAVLADRYNVTIDLVGTLIA